MFTIELKKIPLFREVFLQIGGSGVELQDLRVLTKNKQEICGIDSLLITYNCAHKSIRCKYTLLYKDLFVVKINIDRLHF